MGGVLTTIAQRIGYKAFGPQELRTGVYGTGKVEIPSFFLAGEHTETAQLVGHPA